MSKRKNGNDRMVTHLAIARAKEDFGKMIYRKECSNEDIYDFEIVDFIYAPRAKIDRWARLAVILAAGIYEDPSQIRSDGSIGTIWYMPCTEDCHKQFVEAKNILRKGRSIILRVVEYLPDDKPCVPEESRTRMWEIFRGKRDRNYKYPDHTETKGGDSDGNL